MFGDLQKEAPTLDRQKDNCLEVTTCHVHANIAYYVLLVGNLLLMLPCLLVTVCLLLVW
jgi:hypothetical protein